VNSSETANVLRPLGLGEILDRAVNLCVKHFVALSLIYLAFAVPLAVVQYYASKDSNRLIEALTNALQAQASGSKPADPDAFVHAMRAMPATPNAWYGGLVVLQFLVAPLPGAALIVATAAFYLGKTTTFRDAYATAVKRWLPIIFLNVMYGIAALFAYLFIVLVVILSVLVLAMLTVALHIVGIVLAVLVGIVFAFAGVLLLLLALLAWQVSMFTCVLENDNFFSAFTRGLSRVFAGVGLRRSLVVGFALLAIELGIGLVALTGSVVFAGIAHSSIAATVYQTVVTVATAAFTTAFVGIFYFDLRVREEGLDLQLAARAQQVVPVAGA